MRALGKDLLRLRREPEREQLLDRSTPPWTRTGDDERSILKELRDGLSERVVALHARPQEVLVIANFFDDGGVRRTCDAEQGLRGCSVHLHTFLAVERMRAIGISAFYHDSAAALVEDDRIIAAAQEERFTRKKHDSSFPQNAIEYCLQAGNVRLDELDYIVFYDKPFLKFERLLETYVAMAPRGFRSFKMAIPLWLREKLFQKSLLRSELKRFR